ncbi:hypothetical protein C8J48_0745 [Desmospora activa DSM 45169]|uniref:Uncharacterized protein n=1 Tax=Desmospora activa DSM 45169 TaxID=1121389 RepID=A0A2T4Z8F0_9BACL|nr:hypothetical protein C8J48_0745 [Desmospora activa DSM 45169]
MGGERFFTFLPATIAAIVCEAKKLVFEPH